MRNWLVTCVRNIAVSDPDAKPWTIFGETGGYGVRASDSARAFPCAEHPSAHVAAFELSLSSGVANGPGVAYKLSRDACCCPR